MVTFKNMGRLGNFLFEAAAAWAYAHKHKLEFTVPHKTNDPYWNPLYLQHLAKPFPINQSTIYINEHKHSFVSIPFNESWHRKNICLEGYFQSEKYFNWCREELLAAFGFQWNPHNNVSIHVRRGDYLKYPHKHPIIPDSYYEKAIEYFVEKGFNTFYVFSDDTDWCIEYFKEKKFNAYFIIRTGGNEIEDLVGISECAGGHINSSSTFAWWGAWLNCNPNKIVITPKLWFVPGHNNLDTSDIIPESWIKI